MRKTLVVLIAVLLGGACRVERAAADKQTSDAGAVVDAITTVDAGGGAAAPPERKGPTCTKGCPCGNTCISCSKTCHVGSGTAKKKRGK